MGTARLDCVVPMWQTRELTKVFPGVRALDRLSIDILPGEVHGLLGENGSGKSTLVKCLSGVYQPDAGSIFHLGSEAHLPNPESARKAGVATIFQEFSLVPDLSVAENVFLGRVPKRTSGLIDWKAAERFAEEILHRLDVPINPKVAVGALSVADQQIVEIAKALSIDASLLIMDEPTTAIGLEEIETLHRIVRSFVAGGRAVVYISHRLNELADIADVVTVLKDGKLVGQRPRRDLSVGSIVSLMVGEDISDHYPKEDNSTEVPLLIVEGLSADNGIKDVSFELCRGEVLGLAGLVGSGRTEIAEALFGIVRSITGTVTVLSDRNNRKGPRFLNPSQAIHGGVAFLTENRKTTGLFMNFSAIPNITIASIRRITSRFALNLSLEARTAVSFVHRLRISTRAVVDSVQFLSGGNQQKVLIARWLFSQADIFILDEPTRGIDVGAKVEVYNIINEITRMGKGVILISTDIDELYAMSDRIAIIRGKQIETVHRRSGITKQDLIEQAYVTAEAEQTYRKAQEDELGS
jgi:ribose transport system ATP-binding protein